MSSFSQVTLGDQALSLSWTDGRVSTFHYLWLRDNCQSPLSRHPNGQRILESMLIPSDIRPSHAIINRAGELAITWANDNHESLFSAEWLSAHDYSHPAPHEPYSGLSLWDSALGDTMPPVGDYQEMAANDVALGDWLGQIKRYGFAVVRNLPAEPEAIFKVVDLFGYVRETNYGRLFDVQAVANPENLAYTGLALSAHTDNPYREPVPTLQLLHCIRSEVSGGASILVDGFAIAEQIRQTDPSAFKLLTTEPVRYTYSNEQTHLSRETPIIQLDKHGDVQAIHFNNRSMTPFNVRPEVMTDFYAAYQLFGRLVTNESNMVQFRMQAGDLFIVDNQRVLHGRTGYASSGSRHLQGCYADRDSLYSKLAVLTR